MVGEEVGVGCVEACAALGSDLCEGGFPADHTVGAARHRLNVLRPGTRGRDQALEGGGLLTVYANATGAACDALGPDGAQASGVGAEGNKRSRCQSPTVLLAGV